MNNSSLEGVRKSLREVSKYFDPEKSSYQILNSAANGQMSAEEMMDCLKKIADTKEYPDKLRDYFFNRYKELENLNSLDKEIENTFSRIEKANKELETLLEDRNVNFDNDMHLKETYKEATYKEKTEILEKLKKDEEKINNQIKAVKKEKSTGKEYTDDNGDGIEKNKLESADKKTLDNTHDAQLNKINEDIKKVNEFNNPPLNDVKAFLNFARDHQSVGSELIIHIDYSNEGVVLEIGHHGNKANESIPMTRCNFSDISSFNYEVLPYLVEEHLMENGVRMEDSPEEENSLESGEEIVITGDPEMKQNATNYLNQEKEEHQQYIDSQRKDKKVYVRKLENNKGESNDLLLMIVLVIVSIIIILTIMFFTFLK